MKSILSTCIILLFLSACNSKPEKPNIIFFLVDDMGWQDTSLPFHTEKTKLNDMYYTPSMEKLADQGVKFTQAYATSVCSPTRISLMTGMNAARHRVTNWTLRKNISPDPKHDSLKIPEWNVNGLSLDSSVSNTYNTPTLPQILHDNGYKTIHVGKAHFGAKDTPGENPLNLGFDVNIAGHAAGGPGSYQGMYNYSASFRSPDRIWDVPGLDKYHGTETFLTEALTIEALSAIDSALAEEKPFYLYMSHYAIHAPWEADSVYYGKYIDKGLSKFNATYASMLEGMDKSLGDIMKFLDDRNIADNTIIVFMSDNGAPKQAERNLPLRGHKLTPYEGGIRVPFIAKWPGVTKAKTINEEQIIIEDIFPTFLEMAKVDYKNEVDGKSFVKALRGEKLDENRMLVWHFPHFYDQYPFSVARQGDFKVIYKYYDDSYELYNIKEDLSEKNNLAERNPEKLKELTSNLRNFLEEVDAQTPIVKESNLPMAYPRVD